jgi:hypothetical protein
VVYSNAFKRKTITGPMIIKKAKSFYDKMNVMDKCTFSEDSNNKTGFLCINVTLRCRHITIVSVE